jgi:three-Cys-motif partner protein
MIKARIVAKYFDAWAKVILATQKKYPQHVQRMAYIDLFAGPGRYDDQSKSTPLLVLETILSSPELSGRIITWFNDKDLANIESLKTSISQLPGIERLKYLPAFYNEEVGDEIAEMFSRIKLVPAFFFVDPWGYKGLSLNLVSSIIKDWGCDCVFFFNYNRVNMGVNNDAIRTEPVPDSVEFDKRHGDTKATRLPSSYAQYRPIPSFCQSSQIHFQ